jgi:integrase
MWKIGDRVKTNRSIHGEMVGTVVEITVGYNQSIYHVHWETSKTGTITVKEVAGRDDRDWVAYSPDSDEGVDPAPKPSQALAEAIENAPNLSSDHTKRAYKADLAHFESWRGGEPFNRQLVDEYLTILESSGKSVAAINRALAAVRWWARRDMEAALSDTNLPPARLIARVDQALAINQVKNRIGSTPPAPRQAYKSQVEKLLAVCEADQTPAGRRDAAMILLASQGSLKPGELRRLGYSALQLQGVGSIILERTDRRGWVHQHQLTSRAAQALWGWLNLWETQNGTNSDRRPIFLAINKGGRILDHGLSGQALRDILRKRTSQAGLPALTWEMLRNPAPTAQENTLVVGESA